MRRELGFAPDDVVIGAVGRLESEKRFDLLLEAVAALRQQLSRRDLVIVGEGRLRADLEAAIARLGLGKAAGLLGHRNDVIALHHAFDVFVQSSEREGTPNAVLEAMALETPAVATDVGGTRELMTDGVHGLLVPRHDVRALRDAFATVLADPAAARARATAARARIESELSFEQRMRKVQTVYEDLMSMHPSASAAPSRPGSARTG